MAGCVAFGALLAAAPASDVAAGTQQAVAPADVDLLLTPLANLQARAAAYCRRYQKAMSTVVMEERYVQLVKRWNLPPREPDAARLTWLPGAGALDRQDVNVFERRQIRADLLLVQLRDQRWWAFRDILEVNGHEEHGREDRLRKLFIQQTEDSRRQLQRINQASATFNLGRYYREVNLPTVGLMVLQPVYIPRFSFSAGAVNRVGDKSCRVIAFSETATPTLVRTMDLRNVPLTMWEWYLPLDQDDQGGPRFIEALARYSNLRQFTVETSEEAK
jgi:hypothetical protein